MEARTDGGRKEWRDEGNEEGREGGKEEGRERREGEEEREKVLITCAVHKTKQNNEYLISEV